MLLWRVLLVCITACAAATATPLLRLLLAHAQESMEMDFTKIVGVSILIWACAIVQLAVPFNYRVWRCKQLNGWRKQQCTAVLPTYVCMSCSR